MSRIRVNEIDLSNLSASGNGHTVLVLGYYASNLSPGLVDSPYMPKVYNTIKEFTTDYPDSPALYSKVVIDTIDSVVHYFGQTSYRYAYDLIKAGYGVIYYNLYLTADAADISLSTVYTRANNTAVVDYTIFTDKDEYDITFITTGGLVTSASATDDTLITTLCSNILNNPAVGSGETYLGRYDCVVLSDISINATPATLLDDTYDDTAVVNNTYVCRYGPWIYYDTINDVAYGKYMPLSYGLLLAIAESIKSGNNIWSAPAGVVRGKLPGVTNTRFKVSESFTNEWQGYINSSGVIVNPTTHGYLNPVSYKRGYGYVIDGQKTLVIPANMDSALSQLSVRLVSNEINKYIHNVCVGLEFEPNTALLWNEFSGTVSPYLDKLVYSKSIYDYEIVLNTDNDNTNIVSGYVEIRPTKVAEFFNIDFVLRNSEE